MLFRFFAMFLALSAFLLKSGGSDSRRELYLLPLLLLPLNAATEKDTTHTLYGAGSVGGRR